MYFPLTIKNYYHYDLGWFGMIIYKNGGFRDFCHEYRGKNFSPVSCDPGGARCHNTTSPSRCWPPRIEMAAANIRKSYRNLRPHFHRRQLMEGVGVLSTQYFISDDTLCEASVDVLLLTWFVNLHCSVCSVRTFLYASPRPICSLFIQNKCINALQCKSMRYIDNGYRSVQHFTPTGDTVQMIAWACHDDTCDNATTAPPPASKLWG